MIGFTEKEARIIKRNSLTRLATVSKDGMPHVTPVVQAFDGVYLYVAIDYGTKKLKNLRDNNRVSLVLDDRTDRGGWGIMIQGEAQILEAGEEYRKALKILFARFDFYRNDPWGERESPILKIRPTTKVSWGVG